MKNILLILLLLSSELVFAQREYKTWFKPVTAADLNMKNYNKDTSAAAVVLSEVGISSFEVVSLKLIIVFTYHERIKIFKKDGFDAGTIIIPLNIRKGEHEVVADLKAQTFNMGADGSILITKLQSKDTYQENQSKYLDRLKFTFPNLREGSVIEFSYRIFTPFIYNLRPWSFQSDIPKVQCEYQTEIPELLDYNQHLSGYLSLSKRNTNVTPAFYNLGDKQLYDRVENSFFMTDVPAFKNESYMADASNYLSTMQFQLASIQSNSAIHKEINKDWKQATEEMLEEPQFGSQINRAREIFKHKTDSIKKALPDRLSQAKAIYTFIKGAATCNKHDDMFTDKGVRTAFEKKAGNTAEFNLALIGALRAMGLTAEPLILSTRDHAFPNLYYPNLEEFDYVICQLKIDSTVYLLDASSKEYEFGTIPHKCINGNGRVLRSDFSSDWVVLKNSAAEKRISLLDLTLQPDGKIAGKLTAYYYGHAAVVKREKIHSFSNQEDYLDDLNKGMPQFKISGIELQHTDEPDKILTEILTLELFGTPIKSKVHFNPFVMMRFKQNPFVSIERIYPVDIISPITETLNIRFHYPANFKITELPAALGIRLPANGGSYMLNTENVDNTLTIGNQLILAKSIYSIEEYGNLKEFLRRVVFSQNASFLIEKIN